VSHGRALRSGATVTLLRHRPFRQQFLASLLSMIGSALTPVALAVGVLQATGSAAQLGLVLAAYSVSQVVFVIAGGVWADRLPRQRLMMLADGVRVITQIGFGLLLITGWTHLWAMILLQGLCGAASALFLPASVGLVADTSPLELRQEANALLWLTRNITGTIGPIVAGTLIVLTGAGWALIFDGLTFAGSLLFLSRLRLRERDTRGDETTGFIQELCGGWREVTRRSWVWTTIVYCMVFNVAFAAFQVLGPATLVKGNGGAVSWGLVVAGLGLGQVAGNAIALAWRPHRPLLVGRLIMLAAAPMLVLLAVGASLPALLVGSLVCGVAISFPDTLWDAALQDHIQGSALARVSSFDFLGSFLLRPAGLALASALAGILGTAHTLLLGGAVMAVATLVSLIDPLVRRLTRHSGVRRARMPTVRRGPGSLKRRNQPRSLLVTKYPDAIGAWVAEMGFGIAKPIHETLLREARNGTLGYNDPASLAEARESVAEWMRRSYSWDVAPATVGFVSDIVSGFGAVLRHFLPPGAAVVVPTPAYPPFLTVPKLFGHPVVQVPGFDDTTGHRMDLDGIDRALAHGGRLVVLCNPHNPTGRSFTQEELTALAILVESHGARVFSDEVHAPIRLMDHVHLPYAALGQSTAAHTITATSTSKAWNVSGLKCAQLVFTSPKDAVVWDGVADFYVRSVSRLGVATVRAAYDEQESLAWLAATLTRLRANSAAVARCVADSMPGVVHSPSESTYLAWLDCRGLGLAHPSKWFREQAGVAMSDGADFGSPAHVRLNFALPEPLLKELLGALVVAVSELQASGGSPASLATTSKGGWQE
jgi:cysteine-S-conjugate beta-lyase